MSSSPGLRLRKKAETEETLSVRLAKNASEQEKMFYGTFLDYSNRSNIPDPQYMFKSLTVGASTLIYSLLMTSLERPELSERFISFLLHFYPNKLRRNVVMCVSQHLRQCLRDDISFIYKKYTIVDLELHDANVQNILEVQLNRIDFSLLKINPKRKPINYCNLFVLWLSGMMVVVALLLVWKSHQLHGLSNNSAQAHAEKFKAAMRAHK